MTTPDQRLDPCAAEALHGRVSAAVEQAWRRLLAGGGFDLDRSWADGGGDSLRGLKLMLHIEDALRAPAMLDVMSIDTTPRSLIHALVERLSPALPHADARPLVFMAPGATGDSPPLAQLRRALAQEIRFELIRYPDIDRSCAEIADLDVIVSEAVDQVRAGAPERVRLVGYSFGGGVALEIARRLAAAGAPPALVCVLDTDLGPAPPRPTWAEDLHEQMQIGPVWFVQSLPILFLVRKGRFDRVRRIVLWLKRRFGAHRAVGYQMWLVAALRRRAAAAVSRAPFNGRIVLLRAVQGSQNPARDLGWGAVAAQVEVIDTPGGHVSMLEPPHLAATAAIFRRAVIES